MEASRRDYLGPNLESLRTSHCYRLCSHPYDCVWCTPRRKCSHCHVCRRMNSLRNRRGHRHHQLPTVHGRDFAATHPRYAGGQPRHLNRVCVHFLISDGAGLQIRGRSIGVCSSSCSLDLDLCSWFGWSPSQNLPHGSAEWAVTTRCGNPLSTVIN